MNRQPFTKPRLRIPSWVASAILGATLGPAALAWGQAPSQPAPLDKGIVNSAPAAQAPAAPPVDAATAAPGLEAVVQPAGCSTCGSSLGGGIGGCSSCGSGGACVPGHTNEFCDGTCGWLGDNFLGRSIAGLYQCICCPDPCYEGKWLPIADSAFFVDEARPQTQVRFEFDAGIGLQHPDRAEYYWSEINVRGPSKSVGTPVDYQSLNLYTEVAAGGFGAFVEMPYVAMESDTTGHIGSGFGDVTVGTKSMLLDCELLQSTFEFKTFIPAGIVSEGLGTGHCSLEPSLLFNLKISSEMYSQAQFSYWIPIGGDSGYQGNIYHTHLSLNRTIWHPTPGIQLVATAEFQEWSILSGGFNADPGNHMTFVSTTYSTIVDLGPGLRLFVCEKLDLGVGAAFALTGPRWEEELIRAELRWRF